MERMVEEVEYVLATLYRVRDEVYANPEFFVPGAQERIDEAIARVQQLVRSSRSELMMEQKVKAA